MAKTIYNIILVLIVICFFAACSKPSTNSGSLSSSPFTIEGYAINNSALDESATSYHIEDLKSFFSTTLLDADKLLNLEDINAKYPITHLRKTGETAQYYIAYPVSEGGKFLVFLCVVIDPETGDGKFVYSDSLYIYDLPNEKVFANLTNANTYEDVKEIAPCSMLTTVRSSSIVSHSVLPDAQILQCTYSRSEDGILYWQSMEIFSYGETTYPFKDMLYSDLIEGQGIQDT